MKPAAFSALLAATALAAPLTACGSSGPSATRTSAQTAPTTASPRTDVDIAQAGLLRLSDFPPGWTTGANPAAEIHCPAIDAAERNAKAKTGRFTDRLHASSQQVVVLRSAGAAAASAGQLISPTTLACIAHATEAGIRSGASPGIRIGRMTVARLPLARAGDRTDAARLTLTASGNGVRVQVHDDVAFTRVGRGISMLAVVTQGTTDDALLNGLVARAAQRLRTALVSGNG